MNLDQIRSFLTALRVKNVEYSSGSWVRASCPLARWSHQGGFDSSPSFGVAINDEGPSHFNCYVCNSGSLADLLQTIEMRLADTPDELTLYDFKTAREILDGEEVVISALPEFSEFKPGAYAEFQDWPEHHLDEFVPWKSNIMARHYVLGRVPEVVADHFNLRWDNFRKMVAAPYRNVYGRLAGMRGRAILPETPKHERHHDYTWNKVNNAELCWYNEAALNCTGPLLVVEGQFDVMHCWQVTNNVLGQLGSKSAPSKLKRLLQAEAVILMLDNDAAGVNGTNKLKSFLAHHDRPHGVLDYSLEWKDPAKVPLEWIRDQLKDIMPVK